MTFAFDTIMAQLDACTADEQELVFRRLRENFTLHPLEDDFGVRAEVIMEAIHRAPELTRRMLRGVIADAAFHFYVVPMLGQQGWTNIPLDGNYSYDHALRDLTGTVTVQVKLQRSEAGSFVVTDGRRHGKLPANNYLVEVQRTRTGKRKVKTEGGSADVEEALTRPYKFGEFDILAVSLWPSTKDWTKFRYTVGSWLVPHATDKSLMATFQPVAMSPDGHWTDDFTEVVRWLRGSLERQVAPNALSPFCSTQVQLGPTGLGNSE